MNDNLKEIEDRALLLIDKTNHYEHLGVLRELRASVIKSFQAVKTNHEFRSNHKELNDYEKGIEFISKKNKFKYGPKTEEFFALHNDYMLRIQRSGDVKAQLSVLYTDIVSLITKHNESVEHAVKHGFFTETPNPDSKTERAFYELEAFIGRIDKEKSDKLNKQSNLGRAVIHQVSFNSFQNGLKTVAKFKFKNGLSEFVKPSSKSTIYAKAELTNDIELDFKFFLDSVYINKRIPTGAGKFETKQFGILKVTDLLEYETLDELIEARVQERLKELNNGADNGNHE
ncbi:hypothetical protein [Stutzerimonas zhaodongensis]|uniref:hypothetical protein n=1 Tax=Stutzerimonas zhaodongensis TaxID=1176257 RepID=UPI001F4E11CC|nr:hypothetical protein [Stutzerimonas zhaodongensis]UNG20215.1 hypothetical protein MKP10_08305 [Stutzerimonas zhaodongensis]